MKKVLFIIIPALILALIVFLSYEIFFLKRNEKGALQVTADPQSKVYLDAKYLGQTPLCKCDANDMLPVGDYTLKIVPPDNTLVEFQQKITITKAILTVVDRTFAKGAASEGSVISLTPLPDKKLIQLLTITMPDKADIYLDNNLAGEGPLLLSDVTESDHIIKVKRDGYKDKSVRIHTPKGYKLTAAVFLGVADGADSSSSQATQSAKVTPSPTSSVAKVTILQTPTGFLRVRQDPSLSGAEIGRVNPGKNYELVSEQTGWFQIKMSNGTLGWISSDYAQKQ